MDAWLVVGSIVLPFKKDKQEVWKSVGLFGMGRGVCLLRKEGIEGIFGICCIE